MTKNPYADSDSLAEPLWETGMVADIYSNGTIMLSRTKNGWQIFIGALEDAQLREIEKSLDKNVPSYEKDFGEISKMPNLIVEPHRLLPQRNVA